MIKKTIIFILFSVIAVTIIWVILITSGLRSIPPIQAVTNDSKVFIQIPDIKSSKILYHSDYIPSFLLMPGSREKIDFGCDFFRTLLPWLDTKKSYPAIISGCQNNTGQYSWIYMLGDFHFSVNEFLEFLSIDISEVKQRKFENQKLYYTTYNASKIVFSIYENLLLISESEALIENSIRAAENKQNKLTDVDFSFLYSASGKYIDGSVFINSDVLKIQDELYDTFLKRYRQLGLWAMFDMVEKNNICFLGGFVLSDSLHKPEILKNQGNILPDIIKVLPQHVVTLETYATTNMQAFQQDQQTFLRLNNTLSIYNKLKDSINRVYNTNVTEWMNDISGNYAGSFSVSFNNNIDNLSNFYFVRLSDPHNARGKINDFLAASNGHWVSLSGTSDFYVFELNKTGVVDLLSFSFPAETKGKMGFVYGDYLFFTDSVRDVKDFIQMTHDGKTLKQDLNFIKFYDKVYTSGTYSFYCNQALWNEYRRNSLTVNKTGSQEGDLSDIAIICRQHLNTAMLPVTISYQNKTDKSNLKLNNETVIWKSDLDAPALFRPRIFKNHLNGSSEILVADSLNQLYLFTNTGNMLWKIKINHKINTEIYQVDILKNSKLQYLFMAGKELYAIDRNGKMVEGYPVIFRNCREGTLSVIRYEPKSDCRLFMQTEDRKIILCDINGKQISDWKSPVLKSQLYAPVKYIKTGNKDLLCAVDSNGLYLFNRKGQVVYKTVNIKPAPNTEIFNYTYKNRNGLIFNTINGTAYVISLSGKQDSICISSSLSSGHFFICRDFNNEKGEELLYLDGDKLRLYDAAGKQKFYTLIFGRVSSKPLLFQITGNKLAIGVFSDDEQSIAIYNNNGNMLDGFPLPASVSFSMEQDRKLRSKYYIYTVFHRQLVKYEIESK